MNTPPMPDARGPATLQSTTGRIAAVATALLLVLFLVLSVSRAAFTASTSNSGNNVNTSGNVTLRDDDNDSALFTSDGLLPLDVLNPLELAALDDSAQCIHVRYEGDFSSDPVQMFVTPDAELGLGDLAPYLDVTVEMEELLAPALIVDTDTESPTFGETILAPNESHDCTQMEGAVTTRNALQVANSELATPAETMFTGTLAEFNTNHGSYLTGLETFAGEPATYAFKITVNVKDHPAAANKAADWNFVWETQTADL